jgi:hypothetical protein
MWGKEKEDLSSQRRSPISYQPTTCDSTNWIGTFHRSSEADFLPATKFRQSTPLDLSTPLDCDGNEDHKFPNQSTYEQEAHVDSMGSSVERKEESVVRTISISRHGVTRDMVLVNNFLHPIMDEDWKYHISLIVFGTENGK